jgi:hypothetical protein
MSASMQFSRRVLERSTPAGSIRALKAPVRPKKSPGLRGTPAAIIPLNGCRFPHRYCGRLAPAQTVDGRTLDGRPA